MFIRFEKKITAVSASRSYRSFKPLFFFGFRFLIFSMITVMSTFLGFCLKLLQKSTLNGDEAVTFVKACVRSDGLAISLFSN